MVRLTCEARVRCSSVPSCRLSHVVTVVDFGRGWVAVLAGEGVGDVDVRVGGNRHVHVASGSDVSGGGKVVRRVAVRGRRGQGRRGRQASGFSHHFLVALFQWTQNVADAERRRVLGTEGHGPRPTASQVVPLRFPLSSFERFCCSASISTPARLRLPPSRSPGRLLGRRMRADTSLLPLPCPPLPADPSLPSFLCCCGDFAVSEGPPLERCS